MFGDCRTGFGPRRHKVLNRKAAPPYIGRKPWWPRLPVMAADAENLPCLPGRWATAEVGTCPGPGLRPTAVVDRNWERDRGIAGAAGLQWSRRRARFLASQPRGAGAAEIPASGRARACPTCWRGWGRSLVDWLHEVGPGPGQVSRPEFPACRAKFRRKTPMSRSRSTRAAIPRPRM